MGTPLFDITVKPKGGGKNVRIMTIWQNDSDNGSWLSGSVNGFEAKYHGQADKDVKTLLKLLTKLRETYHFNVFQKEPEQEEEPPEEPDQDFDDFD